MEEKHYIEWIEAITDNDRVYRQFLSPGKAPEAVFNIDEKKITAREYCNEAFQEPGELYGYSAKALCRGEKSARASLTAEKAFDRVILTDKRFTGVPIKDFNCWRTNGNNIEKRT